jgi:hypothetical protein
MKLEIQVLVPVLGMIQKCGEVKLVNGIPNPPLDNGIPNLPLLIMGSQTSSS